MRLDNQNATAVHTVQRKSVIVACHKSVLCSCIGAGMAYLDSIWTALSNHVCIQAVEMLFQVCLPSIAAGISLFSSKLKKAQKAEDFQIDHCRGRRTVTEVDFC